MNAYQLETAIMTTDELRDAWKTLRDVLDYKPASVTTNVCENVARIAKRVASDYAYAMNLNAYAIQINLTLEFGFFTKQGEVVNSCYIDRINESVRAIQRAARYY